MACTTVLTICEDNVDFVVSDKVDINFSIIDGNDLNFSVNDSNDLNFLINDQEDLNYSISDQSNLMFIINEQGDDINFALSDIVVIKFDDHEESEVAFAKRRDIVGEQYIYRAEAPPGSADSAPVWRISRVEFIGDDVEITWANGNDDFNKIWDNHLLYTYS